MPRKGVRVVFIIEVVTAICSIERLTVSDTGREGIKGSEKMALSGISNYYIFIHRGGTVVKVLCYKSEGRWFDSRWCHWNFSLT